jgi:hypothetical protein
MSNQLDNFVSAFKPLVVLVVVVAPERDGHLVAVGSVLDFSEGGGVPTVNVALSEVPER